MKHCNIIMLCILWHSSLGNTISYSRLFFVPHCISNHYGPCMTKMLHFQPNPKPSPNSNPNPNIHSN